jgi:hypothetical protein
VLVSSSAAGLHTDARDLDIVCDTRAGGFLEAVAAACGERPGFEHWTAGTRQMILFSGERLLVELAGEALSWSDRGIIGTPSLTDDSPAWAVQTSSP